MGCYLGINIDQRSVIQNTPRPVSPKNGSALKHCDSPLRRRLARKHDRSQRCEVQAHVVCVRKSGWLCFDGWIM